MFWLALILGLLFIGIALWYSRHLCICGRSKYKHLPMNASPCICMACPPLGCTHYEEWRFVSHRHSHITPNPVYGSGDAEALEAFRKITARGRLNAPNSVNTSRNKGDN